MDENFLLKKLFVIKINSLFKVEKRLADFNESSPFN
jgi:hypothetical protein